MKAYEVINSPEKWTIEEFARDRLGEPVNPHSSKAARWCASGAIAKVYGAGFMETAAYVKLLEHLADPDHLVCYWNDRSNWETVYSTMKELDI